MSLSRSCRAFARPSYYILHVAKPSSQRPIFRAGSLGLQTRDLHNQPRNTKGEGPGQPTPHVKARSPVDSLPHVEQDQSGWAEREARSYGPSKVQILRPALVVLGLSCTFISVLSFFRAKEELKTANRSLSSYLPQMRTRSKAPPGPLDLLENEWKRLDPVSRLSWGIIGANSAIHLAGFPFPGVWNSLWHIPASNRLPTLLTSAFVHAGPMHLGFNMWASYQFLPPVGYSKLFRGDTFHISSFLLSTAVLTGWSQHVASAIFQRGVARFTPGGGFSGALFAILGAYCTEYPTHKIGIVFLPFSFEAQYFFPAVMLFDFVGMVRGYKFVNFGHAAHLSGALLGLAYSYFDGYGNVWRPAVGFWKRYLVQQKNRQ